MPVRWLHSAWFARLVALVALVSLAQGCGRRRSPEVELHAVPMPAPAPLARALSQPMAAEAPELPALEHERLHYLFASARLVARTWPALAVDETCLLLVAQAAQWVVNCPEAPSQFVQLTARFRGRPVFAHAGGSFDSSGETRSTRELLERTPAAAHLSAPGATSHGLPSGHPWLLLGTLDALRAYHPAFAPATTESWLSVALHEFVHIHQLRQPAFAAELAQLDSPAFGPAALAAVYASDRRFAARIAREYAQLTAAANHASTPEAARAALQRWLRSYRARSTALAARPEGTALVHAERVWTYLEGVARFVESDYLANQAQHPREGLTSDPAFQRFAAFVGRGYAGSPNRQLDREYYYAIGYHLCVLLGRVDPSWSQRVAAEPGQLIGLVERLASSRGGG